MSNKWVDLRSWPSRYGEALINERGFIVLSCGDTAPVDGTAGYEVGAMHIDTNAADGSQWLRNDGTATSCDFNMPSGGVDMSLLTASAAELNKLDDDLATNIVAPGAGVSAAETLVTGIFRNGNIIETRIMVDLTGLVGSATDLDIIGNTGGAASANIGQVTVAKNGTLCGGIVECLEVPAGGSTDIDFYSATVGTGAQDVDVTTLTETVLITSGGAWASGTQKGMTTVPPANDFLYICNGAASGGTFSAGKFLIRLYGKV